jgi:hypothetical protein
MHHSQDLSVAITKLTKARNFISDPANWSKEVDLTCDFTGCDYQACVVGALEFMGVERPQAPAPLVFDPEYRLPLEHRLMYQALLSLDRGYNNVITFNDAAETTHKDVMQLFNRAIYLAKADELENKSEANSTLTTTVNAA